MRKTKNILLWTLVLFLLSSVAFSQTAGKNNPKYFNPVDVFQLEFASDLQISPDGTKVVYVRNFMDIMTDRPRSNLWMINFDGSENRPLTSGSNNYSSPRWSPDGKHLVFVSNAEGSSQVYIHWMDTGHKAKISNLMESPRNISWSPDGKWIAFSMFVPLQQKPFVKMPQKPQGAEWAKPSIYIDKVQYRQDGQGYIRDGYNQIFVLPVEGTTPRQLTSGEFNHGGSLAWTPDNKAIVFSANRHKDWEYDPQNSEIHRVSVADGSISALTDRHGPDRSPAISPDGKKVAYLGLDERYQGYQVTHLYVMNIDGKNSRWLIKDLDRSISSPIWSSDGKGIYFQYSTEGNTKIAFTALDGKLKILTGDVGGTSLGRPYSSGSYSVARNGRFAFTHSRPDHPADVAVGSKESSKSNVITSLNEDLFGHKELGKVEEIWFESSYDDRKIQGWIVKPPGFDPNKKYPLVLEIHGGPFANYGDRFTAEIQLYASAGYVGLYTNPRGSTSYGGEFGNLIHHNYPSQDFDDLMSGVDAVIEKGYIDKDNLFVTGGSGGGVLSSWIVGHTDRFRAAVVQKPVINWYSWALYVDGYITMPKYWFPGYPWDNLEHYMKRSPISYVGNVTTPTMLLTGEEDLRTPMVESEQFYQALKLRKIDAALVRVPGAYHGIAARPSNLIAKVIHVLGWFEKYRKK